MNESSFGKFFEVEKKPINETETDETKSTSDTVEKPTPESVDEKTRQKIKERDELEVKLVKDYSKRLEEERSKTNKLYEDKEREQAAPKEPIVEPRGWARSKGGMFDQLGPHSGVGKGLGAWLDRNIFNRR